MIPKSGNRFSEKIMLNEKRRMQRRSPLFRAGIDDRPKVGAVLDLLHLGGEPAIAADPVLHRVGVIGHQVRGAFGAGDLDAEGEGLVVIGLVEAEARLRRDADLVHRHDAEHQRAGGIADTVDDDALALVADALVLGLVFLDIAAMVARDVQLGARRACGEGKESCEGKKRDAHGVTRYRNAFETRNCQSRTGPSPKTLAGLCWEFVKYPKVEEKSPLWPF